MALALSLYIYIYVVIHIYIYTCTNIHTHIRVYIYIYIDLQDLRIGVLGLGFEAWASELCRHMSCWLCLKNLLIRHSMPFSGMLKLREDYKMLLTRDAVYA